jgi:predicted DNA-binding helix-hairpin-helix protein
MPGAEDDQVAACLRLADRVSINLEAPNEKRLPELAPQKDFNSQLMRPLQRVAEFRRNPAPVAAWKGRWPSVCTQFVLGAAGETDRELLETTQSLHRDYLLSRAYFSAFTPQDGTPLAHHPPVSHRRELRLYQADFLIRDYGFSQEDLVFDQQGHLPAHVDPKMAWAECHLTGQPVEINRASVEDLLRVPGIGPKSITRILEARRLRIIRDFSGLGKLGVNARRASAYILLDGRAPARQMSLF